MNTPQKVNAQREYTLPYSDDPKQSARRQQVAEMWLKGWSYTRMSNELFDGETGMRPSSATLLTDVRAIRDVLADQYESDLKENAHEAIARLDREISFCDDKRMLAETIEQEIKWTGQISRLNESRAKIQGVLNDRHIHVNVGEQTFVTYTFQDKTPPPPGIETSAYEVNDQDDAPPSIQSSHLSSESEF